MKREVMNVAIFVALVLLGSVLVIATSHSAAIAPVATEDDKSVSDSTTDKVTDRAVDRVGDKRHFKRVRDKTFDATDIARDRDSDKAKYTDRVDCVEIDKETDRIRCRLAKGDKHDVPRDKFPDVCRRLHDSNNDFKREDCRDLYHKIRQCHRISDKPKAVDQCYKRVLNWGFSHIRDEVTDRAVTDRAYWRHYVYALMDNLIHRVEFGVEHGDISPATGEEFITMAFKIQEAILGGEPKSVIRPMIVELKAYWREHFT